MRDITLRRRQRRIVVPVDDIRRHEPDERADGDVDRPVPVVVEA